MVKESEVSAATEFATMFHNTSRTVNLIGFNVLNAEWRPNWRTALTFFVIAGSLFILGCTLMSRTSNIIEFFQVLPFGMLQVQGMHKIIVRIARPQDYYNLYVKSKEIFELLNENKNNNLVLYKSLKIATNLQKLMYAMYLTTVIFLDVMPICVWMILGERILAVPLFMPLVDETTVEGFVANYVSHLMMLLIAACGFVSIDCMFLAFVIPIAAYANAIEGEVQQLNDLLEQPKRDDKMIEEKCNLLYKVHQTLLEYESLLEDHNNIVMLFKVASIILGMVTNIIVIFKSSFPQAYFLITIFFVQLTQYCLMGTVVTNEQMLKHLYNINWHLLPPKHAKHLVLILHQAQNASSVTIGRFAELNVESYVSVLKTIYTYVMMLATFME
ncbi:hypothetical protein pipiens_018215 [Culex pipiens pipiens]|uniref:Odorant receptor n=1 Tax=Culex pipiens pipiens TaxID=38569 RepID=A0ABD1CCV6_CULPP